jgi:hypothetical protein
MKKRNLHSLQLRKSTISNLNSYALKGGNDQNQTVEDACQNKTHTTCSQLAKCDSVEICSAKCEPINADDQAPIG